MTNLSLIIVSGLPCCGKSTVAEGISRELGVVQFSVDPIESAVLQAGIVRSFETGLAAYLIAEKLAGENLALGHSAIIDCVCSVDVAKQMWRDLAKKHGAKLIVIECVCSDEQLHRERVEARIRNMPGITEVTWDDIEARRSEYAPWTVDVLRLDAVNASDGNIAEAVKYVSLRAKSRNLLRRWAQIT